jgi:hypothetical protein
MAVEEPDDLTGVDRAIRHNERLARARELAGGDMSTFATDDAPPSREELFFNHLLAFDEEDWTSQFAQLEAAGVPLPDPATLRDDEIHTVLWAVIHAMAAQRTYLSNTDHLSDRELYTHLWEDSLHEITPDVDVPGMNCHLDILGGCSEEDLFLRHKYYADEDERALWLKSFPEDEMPAHVDPPYDRDRHLPEADRDW